MFEKLTDDDLAAAYDGHRENVKRLLYAKEFALANYHARRATEIAVELAARAYAIALHERQLPLFPADDPDSGAA